MSDRVLPDSPLYTATPGDVAAHHAALADTCLDSAARGAAWFLVVAALLEAVVFYCMAQTLLTKRSQIFHHLTYIIMLLPAVAYVGLLSGYGMTAAAAPVGDRCFFDARWLSLMLIMPLLVASVALLAGLNPTEMALFAIFAALFEAAAWAGGDIVSNNRWFMFVFAFLFAVPLLWALWGRFGLQTDLQHEYAELAATRCGWLCNILFVYILAQIGMWVISQGAAVITSGTELLILGIIDIVFLSCFCISLVSDREVLVKMSELHERGFGWLQRAGGNKEYSSIESREERGVAGGVGYRSGH